MRQQRRDNRNYRPGRTRIRDDFAIMPRLPESAFNSRVIRRDNDLPSNQDDPIRAPITREDPFWVESEIESNDDRVNIRNVDLLTMWRVNVECQLVVS